MKKKLTIILTAIIAISCLNTQKLIRSVQQNNDLSPISTITINSECRIILTGASSKNIYLFNASTGDKILKAFPMSDVITSLAYSGDNTLFAGGAANGSIFL